MYNKYGAIKKGAQYEFRLYAPQATQVYLVLNGQQLEMIKEETDFVLLTNAEHLDTYYYLIDATQKFDPFATYITDGCHSHVYESNYALKHAPLITPIDNDSKILELYLPFVNGNDYEEKAEHIINKVKEGQHTHVLLLPLQYHWYIGSLGYHTQGFFSPSFLYGEPDSLKKMIDRLHEEGIAIILDFAWWETTDTPEGHALLDFAGGLYLNEDYNEEFGGHYFDFNEEYVVNFMKAAFDYWLNVYNIDYLKLDGINEYVFTKPDRVILQDKVNKVNVLTDGIEDRLIFEFIDMLEPEEFGFNVKRHDGIIMPFLIEALYRYWIEGTYEDQGTDKQIDAKVFEDWQLTGANHNMFLKSISYNEPLPQNLNFENVYDIAKLFIKEVNEEKEKELLFILKFIYAAKRPVVEFGHLDKVSIALNEAYKSYKQEIDTIYNVPEITKDLNGYTVKYKDNTLYFNFATKEVKYI